MRLIPRFALALVLLGSCANEPGADAQSADPAPAQSDAAAESAPSVSKPAPADSGAVSSVYTSLAQADCRVTEVDEESESSTQRCPGTAGYALNVLEGDLRMSIDVIAPDGATHELNYWGVITGAFSSLGPRAEWRMRGGHPIALIVRVNASENPEDSTRITSYLAVAKLTPGEICVTDRIAPSANANQAARDAADGSAERPCLSSS